jgi:hypothetical protein
VSTLFADGHLRTRNALRSSFHLTLSIDRHIRPKASFRAESVITFDPITPERTVTGPFMLSKTKTVSDVQAL